MAVFFKRSEFVRASSRSSPATLLELARADRLAELLDPIRREVGPIRITSWLRETGSHATGGAVDLQLLVGTNAQIRRLADLIASRYLPSGELRQVIFEMPTPRQFRAHIHITTVLVDGATPGYLGELSGKYPRQFVQLPIPEVDDALQLARRSRFNMAGVVAAPLALLSMWRAFGGRVPTWLP